VRQNRSHQTIDLLQRETAMFILPDLWLPNSPDLNPVDYQNRGVVHDRLRQTPVRDVADLRQRLIDACRIAFWTMPFLINCVKNFTPV